MILASILSLLVVNALSIHTPYYVKCPNFPTLRADEYPEDTDEDVTFDPELHLDL
jgi:hypothetical protein